QGDVHARQCHRRLGRGHHLPHGAGGRQARPGAARRGSLCHAQARRDRHAHPPDHPRHRALRGRQLLLAQRAHRAGRALLSPERGRGATERGSAGRPGRASPQDRSRRVCHAHRRPARDGRPGSRPHQYQPGALATARHAEGAQDQVGRGAPCRQPARGQRARGAAGQGPSRHQQRPRHGGAPRRPRRRGRAHRLQRMPEERRGHPLLDGAAHPRPRLMEERSMRARLRFLLTLALTATVAWGGAALAATPDDTLVIGYNRAANNLHPGVNASLPNIWANMLIYDSLVIHDAQGKAHPALAKRWEVSKDGLVWTFYLRDDVKFHSGRKLTATDVKAHFDLWKTMPTATKIAALEKTDVVNDTTVRFTLKNPTLVF